MALAWDTVAVLVLVPCEVAMFALARAFFFGMILVADWATIFVGLFFVELSLVARARSRDCCWVSFCSSLCFNSFKGYFESVNVDYRIVACLFEEVA